MSDTLDPDVAASTPPPLPTATATPTETAPPESPEPPPLPGAAARLECPSCGGAVQFTPRTTSVTCLSCSGLFPIPDGGDVGEEHDLRTALADPRAAEGGDTNSPTPARELDRELVCPNCHGAVAFVGTLTATRCPFCARPVTREDIHTSPDRFPVDGIVPFGLDIAGAERDVRAWMSKRKWAPRAFKKYASLGSFAGVYLPFFTFDAYTVTKWTGRRGTNETRTVYRDGKRETEHYIDWTSVSGTLELQLDDVPVAAESSVNRDRMHDLEPWPSENAIGFRPEYLAGYTARRYDRSLQACQVEARDRMNERIDTVIKRQIGGDHQEIDSKETKWRNETFRHLLLPVYLLTVTYRSKPYQVAVNGVTGEVHGKRPYSWAKIGSVVLAVVLALTGVGVYAWQYESSTVSISDTSDLPAQVSIQEREALLRADAEAQDATRTFTPEECREAVEVYRLRTPDTFFPDVRACAALSPDERRTIAREIFADEEITTARRALLALGIGSPARQWCRANVALAGAKIAAKQYTAADARDLTEACAGLPQATIDRFSDDYADAYLERRKQALADAP
ncbi:hypothetical protein [Sporichthya polymorpha]|uniref:hypothetical protein n=1 Tax=Sporichthya polymorpha TaxID=35751 RepID=UPI00039BBCE0|nr:hypothetical protein [Sporichthya polymorpha]